MPTYKPAIASDHQIRPATYAAARSVNCEVKNTTGSSAKPTHASRFADEGRSNWERRAKRALDLAIAPIALVAFSPLLFAAMLATRLNSPGPAIFRQVRLGAHGRPFTLYKIRTMYVDNDDRQHRAYVRGLINGARRRNGGLYKLTDDPRITRVGRHLRRLSIDEVPQLINVIRGEMSLVGPRPALPSEVQMYDERQLGRLTTPPGITGLWQVNGRCELTYREMIDLDLEYVERWTLWRDLKILWATPAAVASCRGAA